MFQDRFFPKLCRRASFAAAVLALASLAACNERPERSLALATGIASEPKPAPDFISSSRPATLDYLPVPAGKPEPPNNPERKAKVEALEAELTEVRTATEARGAATRAAGAASAAAPPTAGNRSGATGRTP